MSGDTGFSEPIDTNQVFLLIEYPVLWGLPFERYMDSDTKYSDRVLCAFSCQVTQL